MALWCIYWDPCGLACFILGIATVLLVDYVTIFEVLVPWFRLWRFQLLSWGWLHVALFQAMIFLILISYVRAATSDPGSVEKGTASKKDIYPPPEDPDREFKPKRRFCEKCQCIKPPRAHHCSTCHRCINKMDHHCPWVNNCVGSNNMKFFLLFLVWTCVGASYAATLAIYRFVTCWKSGRCAIPPTHTVILVVFSTVMAIFFAIFTIAMMWDQYQGLTTDTTAIEAMKNWDETPRSVVEGLRDACGNRFNWRWLLPVSLPRDTGTFYRYQPNDDPDAYDPRDPVIKRHFRMIEKRIQEVAKAETAMHALYQQQRTDSGAKRQSKRPPMPPPSLSDGYRHGGDEDDSDSDGEDSSDTRSRNGDSGSTDGREDDERMFSFSAPPAASAASSQLQSPLPPAVKPPHRPIDNKSVRMRKPAAASVAGQT